MDRVRVHEFAAQVYYTPKESDHRFFRRIDDDEACPQMGQSGVFQTNFYGYGSKPG